MDWKKKGEVSGHAFLTNRVKGQEIIDRFLEATGGRYEPIGANVMELAVKFQLRHEAANAEHWLEVCFRTTPKGRDAYTVTMGIYDHQGWIQGKLADVRGTLKTCLNRAAGWQQEASEKMEKYWQQYQRSIAALKDAGFKHINGGVFVAANVMTLEVSVDGRIRIHNYDHRNVEDIIAAIRPR
jgi:hypothetical protein